MKQLSHRPHPLEQRLAELRAEQPTPYPDDTRLRTLVEHRPDHLRIEFPPDFRWLAAIVLFAFPFAPWITIAVVFTRQLLLGDPEGLVFSILWLTFWVVGGGLIIQDRLKDLFQREILTFGREEWSSSRRFLGWSRTRRFRLHELTAARPRPKNRDSDATWSEELELVHTGGTLRCGRGIQTREAQLVGELIERWVAQTRATLR